MSLTLKQRLFPVGHVLRGYVQPKNPGWVRLRNALFFTTLVIVGLFYGLLVTIFPVYLYLVLALPLAVLVGLVIWALPEARSFPDRAMERLLFAFLIGLFLWPNYLAIALPGLPWITVNRLITFPLVAIFVLSLATSTPFRRELGDVLRSNRWLSRCFILFLICQTYTLVFTQSVGASLNAFIDAQTQWTAIFFISAWVFTKPGRGTLFMKLLMLCAVLMIGIAFVEWRMGKLPWRDLAPGFLIPPDENVARILDGQVRAGVGILRVQGTFSTALNLAEFIAFTLSAAFFWLMTVQTAAKRALLLLYLPVSFFIIILTDSRIGPVGTFATIFIALLLWSYRRWRTMHDDLIAPFILILYPFGAAAFVALSLVWNRLKVMIWGGGQHQASTETRVEQWSNFWPAMARWPIGHGIGQGADQAGTINGNGVLTLDSYYISIFLSYGVIGGLAFFGMFIIGATTAIQAGLRRDGRDENLLLAAGTMIIVFLIIKAVLIQEDSHALLFMVLGLVAGTLHRQRAGGGLTKPSAA